MNTLKKSPESGRLHPLDCAEKHKGTLTPGSRITDLPVSDVKYERSTLGMTNSTRSNAALENTVDLFSSFRLYAISESRRIPASCSCRTTLRMRNAFNSPRQTSKSVRRIKNRIPVGSAGTSPRIPDQLARTPVSRRISWHEPQYPESAGSYPSIP